MPGSRSATLQRRAGRTSQGVVVVIDGPSLTLGFALALPTYLLIDHFAIPWFIDVPYRRMLRAIRRRGR